MAKSELREPTFLILTALADGNKHGYALIKDVASLSDGRVTLRVSTLYAALDRLSTEALIESAGDEVVDGRLRRYYRLSDEGAKLLAAEATRLERNSQQARARLLARPAIRTAVTQ